MGLFVVGCGGSGAQVCPSEKHLADPDGHGERCIDDESTCETASDCAGASACCTSGCEDIDADGIFACTQLCDQPRCTEGSCGPGQHCAEGIDECSAFCVPDETLCEAGRIPADPNGTGEIVCVPEYSTCLEPDDCPVDDTGCCPIVCAFDVEGALACLDSCNLNEGDPGMEPPECASDLECESNHGEPGWTCISDGCGWSYCQAPPAECVTADDCTLAVNEAECCQTCAVAVPWSIVNGDPCWSSSASARPQDDEADEADAEAPGADGDADVDADGDSDGAAPYLCEPACDAVVCKDVECIDPIGVGCENDRCVALY